MASQPLQVTVRIDLGDESDAEELEEAVESLLVELADAPVDVERVTTDSPPEGSKVGMSVVTGVLLVSGQAFVGEILGHVLLEWVRKRRRAKLAIDGPKGTFLVLPDTSPDDLRRALTQAAEGTVEA